MTERVSGLTGPQAVQPKCQAVRRATGLVAAVFPLLAGILLGSSGTIAAQTTAGSPVRSGGYIHESWTVDNGLPVNSLNAVLQSRDGYIWVTTFDGLVRFDGVRFTVFNTANSEGLPNNRLIRLRETRDSSLWMITEPADLIRLQRGRFTHFGPSRGIAAPVTDFFESSDGQQWVSLLNDVGRIEGDRFTSILNTPPTSIVYAALPRRDGRVLLRTSGRGVHHVVNGRVERLVTGTLLDTAAIYSMAEDPAGRAYISASNGVWTEDGDSWRAELIAGRSLLDVYSLMYSPARRGMLGFGLNGVVRIGTDRAQRLDSRDTGRNVAIDSSGAFWYVRGSVLYRNGEGTYALARRASASDITTGLVVDREGSIWLAMSESGLHRVKPALFTTLSEAEGLGQSNITTLHAARDGTIWAGGRVGGVSRIDTAGTIAQFGAAHAVPGSITSLHADEADRLLIGTPGGLFTCALPTTLCTRDGHATIGDAAVYALHRDAASRVWAGTTRGVAIRERDRWSMVLDSSAAPFVRWFTNTQDGALWMATNGAGVLRFFADRITRIDEADGLPSNLVRSLYEDRDGHLWIGTEGRGLARLDTEAWNDGGGDRRILRVGTANGLFDDVIHIIMEDEAGRLWMSSNRGVFWVNRSDLNAVVEGRVARVHSTAYTERDGVRNREANGGFQPAGGRTPDGRLWFPTQDGVVHVDPAAVGSNRLLPPVVIERVIAGDTTQEPHGTPLRLSVDQRDLQIEFTALSLLEPRNVRFRYRLEPYDPDWVDAGNRRTAFYTRVPPGRYTFRVIASNNENVWNEAGAQLSLTLAPYFWETAWFRLSVLFAFASVALVMARGWHRRVQRRANELERIVHERTSTLRDREHQLETQALQLQELDRVKSRFFANVSHEFRTPLTLAIGPLEDIRARVGDSGDPVTVRGIDMALRNSRRLLRLVNQILDVARLDAGHMTLRLRPLDVAGLVRGLASAFTAATEKRGVLLAVDAPESVTGAFDADALEKILTNLLANAVKFTPAGGRISVSLADEDAVIRIVVRDTGPGIPPHHLPHVFERFYQADESTTRAESGTGIGLSLTRELVELHGGTIAVASGAEGGAVFTVTLPKGHPDVADATIPEFGSVNVEPSIADAAPSPHPAEHDHDVPALLIVDDSADLRTYVREHFTGRFRVLEAGDGEEGAALATRELPDIVLTDVMMPGVDGHELCRRLRTNPETDFLPIILLTAQSATEQKIAGLERGADDFIVKPFEMRELEARIDNLIAQRRRLRDRFAHAEATRALMPSMGTEAATHLSPSDEAFVTRVREAVEANFSDPEFGVAELARAVFQDRSHLFRRTRQLFGESPSDLIRRTRIEHAERLLVAGEGTVADIAYAVGFNSVSYFCRCFAEAYGATPAVHRARSHRS